MKEKIVWRFYGPLNIFLSSFAYYFTTPNLFPYLTKDKKWSNTFNLCCSLSNFAGRLITITPITNFVNNLYIIVGVIFAFLVVEIVFCFTMVSEYLVVVILAIHMFLCGYISSIAYYGKIVEESGDNIDEKIVKNKKYQKYVSISN